MHDMPLLIGISGRKQHGKDSAATYFVERHGAIRLAFADELKRMAMQLWDLSFEQVYGDEAMKETQDPRWGLSPRQILQRFGTDVGRNIHPQTWVRRAFAIIRTACAGSPIYLPDLEERRFREISFPTPPPLWVIPDTRFPGEAEAIQAVEGIVLKVVRPNRRRNTDTHTSEMEVDDVREDHLIVNDGTLDDLWLAVAGVAVGVLR